MANPKELLIERGKTFKLEVRWAKDGELTYKPITAITKTAPVRLTVASHGLTEGWPAAVTNVVGMTEINAEANAVKSSDYHQVTVVDPNTIEFNDINAAGFSTYVSGGILQFQTPQDLTGCLPRMDMRDKIGGVLLATSEGDTAPEKIIELSVDANNKKTVVTISATNTAAIAWSKAVTDLEMVSPDGVVTKLKLTSTGKDEEPDPVRVVGEVTT